MNNPVVKIAVEGDDIVIRANKNDLKWVVENDPTFKYEIHDLDQFAKEMVFELQNSQSISNDEGKNRVEELFEWAYEQVYEQGEDNVMTGKDIF